MHKCVNGGDGKCIRCGKTTCEVCETLMDRGDGECAIFCPQCYMRELDEEIKPYRSAIVKLILFFCYFLISTALVVYVIVMEGANTQWINILLVVALVFGVPDYVVVLMFCKFKNALNEIEEEESNSLAWWIVGVLIAPFTCAAYIFISVRDMFDVRAEIRALKCEKLKCEATLLGRYDKDYAEPTDIVCNGRTVGTATGNPNSTAVVDYDDDDDDD